MQENVFVIQRPEAVDCTIWTYQWAHAQLTLRLKRQNSPEIQYLRFSGVQYVAMPNEWSNARFDLLDDEDCLNLLVQVGKLPQGMSLEVFKTKGIYLYQVALPNAPVWVAAHNANKYNG